MEVAFFTHQVMKGTGKPGQFAIREKVFILVRDLRKCSVDPQGVPKAAGGGKKGKGLAGYGKNKKPNDQKHGQY